MQRPFSSPYLPQLTDEAVVARVLAGERELFEILIRRYNQRLFRTAMAIIHDEDDAQETMQETYLKAFEHLGQFSGKAQFSTWLTRIAINEALVRLAKRSKVSNLDLHGELEDSSDRLVSTSPGPEQRLLSQSLQFVLDAAIGRLAPRYRAVFVLRELESLSTAQTAQCLEISEQSVKIRLHRARAFLKNEIHLQANITSQSLYEFLGHRCDRMVESVMQRLVRLHGH